MHIESALAGVPVDDRCKCERTSVFSMFGSKKPEACAKDGK